jgi:hypothetical protein
VDNLSEQADMDNDTGGPERARGLRRPSRASLAAEAAFRERVAELGGQVLEPSWLGALKKHRCRCPENHICSPLPASVQQGQGICRTCTGHDPVDAERRFRARIAELGAELLEPYVGSKTPVLARCAAGHECRPNPGHVVRGGGICRVCAGNDPSTCEAKFLARLAELGATPAYRAWKGNGRPTEAVCAAGHPCQPRPSDALQGHGICSICARKDPATAETAFLARLAELGATSLEPRWQGVDAPHALRCSRGHAGSPRPDAVLRGGGVCNVCAHNGEWDAFYVVTSRETVKFGITDGDASRRLRAHAGDGFTNVVRLALGLPGAAARSTETAVMATLAMAGEKPVRGREYFDISCLALVLDIADSWLPVPVAPPEVRHTRIVREWLQDALFAA